MLPEKLSWARCQWELYVNAQESKAAAHFLKPGWKFWFPSSPSSHQNKRWDQFCTSRQDTTETYKLFKFRHSISANTNHIFGSNYFRNMLIFREVHSWKKFQRFHLCQLDQQIFKSHEYEHFNVSEDRFLWRFFSASKNSHIIRCTLITWPWPCD